MAKTIIFCADGTWNSPGEDEDEKGLSELTNVYKLFTGLAGELSGGTIRLADEQEKELHVNGALVQCAKYIHGVGDSRSPIRKLMGGAAGAGTISRIVRGYTYLSRNYEPGDGIVLTGFSRGAYTARALAGLILSQGLLAKPLTVDRERAYVSGAQAWYRYRKTNRAAGFLQRLAEATAYLPGFLSRDDLKDTDLVRVERIKAVGVWDTVGALGIPRVDNDERTDAFRFADTRLSERVDHGLHAVALDEQRTHFTPTLWDQAGNVKQVAFPGAHADVGGGYPVANGESALSDIALGWMATELAEIGVRVGSPVCDPFAPSPTGVAHKPWLRPPFNLPGKAVPRVLRGKGITEHPSILARRNGGLVVHEPGEQGVMYAPGNLPL
jgi:uncharacterized protein (DUF2235 family)